MPRSGYSPAKEMLLFLLWVLIFVGLPLLSLWMGPVDPPIPP